MNNRETGTEYEDKAAAYLCSNGYTILKRNFYTRAGEIDIIAENEGYLCFVEVKFRSDDTDGLPLEAVDLRKIRRISKAAVRYLHMCGLDVDYTPCRFDVVSILGTEITLIKNAFDAGV